MKDYKRLTDKYYPCVVCKNGKCLEQQYDCEEREVCEAWNRLFQLENKIERGEIDYVADSKTEQTITDLLIEFDEMGFAPTTVCPNAEQYAIDWRERVRKEFARLTDENAELRARLDKAVEFPCKVGDKVYGVGFTDCEDGHTTNEKKKRQIFNVCMKMGGTCEKCKYSLPAIEEFTCTHIQLGACGIYGQSVLIVGDRNENYTENNVFTTREAAEARLAELKGGKQ